MTKAELVIATELPMMIANKRNLCTKNLKSYRRMKSPNSALAKARRKNVIIYYYEFQALADLARVSGVEADTNIMTGLDRLEMSELLHIVCEH